MGRPFKGNVNHKDGIEGYVPLKRSIFRLLKKFYEKNIYRTYNSGEVIKHINKYITKCDKA